MSKLFYNYEETSCHGFSYDKLSLYPAAEALAKSVGYEFVPILKHDWSAIKKDSGENIFLSIADQSYIHKPLSWLKEQMPRCKIVMLGCDSIYFAQYKQYDDCGVVDLHLDLLSEVVEYMTTIGRKADRWSWTTSKSFIDDLTKLTLSSRKTHDAIALIRERGQFATPYRYELRSYLLKAGYKVLMNLELTNMRKVYDLYACSWISLGTTSSSWDQGRTQRTMKGFRDWISPWLNTVLIYDKHSDIMTGTDAFESYSSSVPLYEYDSFQSIIDLTNELKNTPTEYCRWLEKQRQYSVDNTIEKQLLFLFRKHNVT